MWIACDRCNRWYHGACVGMTQVRSWGSTIPMSHESLLPLAVIPQSKTSPRPLPPCQGGWVTRCPPHPLVPCLCCYVCRTRVRSFQRKILRSTTVSFSVPAGTYGFDYGHVVSLPGYTIHSRCCSKWILLWCPSAQLHSKCASPQKYKVQDCSQEHALGCLLFHTKGFLECWLTCPACIGVDIVDNAFISLTMS